MDTQTQAALKKRLEEERATLERELTGIGHLNPRNPSDWEGDRGNFETGTADPDVLADRFEEITTNDGIVIELEQRLNNVKAALLRIEAGTYGTCGECGKPIPAERLEANPAANGCIADTK